MNIFKETFEKSSISRKQVVTESSNRGLKESTFGERIESTNDAQSEFVVEYDAIL